MRIIKLDGLRGFFCLMVVIFHYNKEFLPEIIHNNFFIRQSNTFVDFFFVLSGFVISSNYNKIDSSQELWIYLKKRFIRLYPLLIFSTTLCLLLFLIFTNFQETEKVKAIIFSYIDTVLFLNSTELLNGQYTILENNLGLNYPSWSISAEMISYLVFGLTTLFFVGKRKSVALLLIFAFCIAFCLYKEAFYFSGEFGFIRGLMSFITGYFVCVLSKKQFELSKYFEIILVPTLLAIFYFINDASAYNKSILSLIFIPLFFGTAIFILLKTKGPLSYLLESKPISFLGTLSYSIYLNHALLIEVLPKNIFKLLHLEQNTLNMLMVLVFTLSTIIIYSYFTYNFIEKRGGDYLKRILLKSKQ